MKTLSLITLLVLIAPNIFAHKAVSNLHRLPDGFALLPQDSTELQIYQEATERSLKYIHEGSLNLYKFNLTRRDINENNRKEVLRNLNFYRNNLPVSLKNMQFAVSENVTSEQLCEKDGYTYLFVNPSYPNIIFVCKKMRELMTYRSEKNIKSFAQLVIHEGVHLIDYEGECGATQIEFSLMGNTRDGIQTTMNRDAYSRQCTDGSLSQYASIPKNFGFEKLVAYSTSASGAKRGNK